MMAVSVLESIGALLADDAAMLDDDELKTRARRLGALRAKIDAAALAVAQGVGTRRAGGSGGVVGTRGGRGHHTAVGRGTGGALMWLAKRLRYMPLFAEALADGAITSDHCRVMAKALNPRTLEAFVGDEAMLVGHARTLEADDFAHVVARWRFLADSDGPDPGRQRSSEWHVSSMLDGRHRVDGELDLEDSVEYLAELEARYEEIWQRDHGPDATDDERNRTASQRYADAQVEMARRSSMAGDPDVDDGTPVTVRTTARKTQIIVVCDALAAAGDPTARAELEDGTPVPQDLLQRWLCDSAVGRVVMLAGSIPFDLGKLTYTASDGQRRVLKVRDGGCIVPGCKRRPRWSKPPHAAPCPNGPPNINTLALLSPRHHRHVHDGIIKILPDDNDAGTFTVTRADGT